MRNSESFRAKNVEHYFRSKEGAKESGCPGPAVSSTGQKRTKRIAAALGMLALCFAVTFGCVLPSATQIAFADDLVNTVPNNEVPTGTPFYSDGISTGFVPNGYTTEAKYGPGYGPYKVSGVYQSLSPVSATSFAAGLPLGTISIDQSKITQTGGDTEVVSKNTDIIAGLVKIDEPNRMGYDGTKTGAIKMVPGKINRLDGDLFKVTFADAAILPNGDRADLVITYSNARIVIDQRYASAPEGEQYYHGAVSLAQGNAFSYGGTDATDFTKVSYKDAAERAVNTTAGKYYDSFANKSSKAPSTGVTIDATYQIVNKDGTPAAGTFVFAICGVNLDRDPDVGGGNNVAKPLWYSYDEHFGGTGGEGGENGKVHSFFSEAMEITGGKISQNVYVRPNNKLEDNPEVISGVKGQFFWANVAKNGNNVKFISNATNSPSLGGHDASYSAGFVALADAATGFKVTATGHGSSANGMNSLVFNSKQIWYRYISESGNHGKIETTSEGNWGGKLRDGGKVLPGGTIDVPNTYVIAEGKTVTYTMTPDIGYKLKNLKIGKKDPNDPGRLLRDREGNIIWKEVKFSKKAFTDEGVSRMKKGDTLTVATAAGQKGILKYEEDGTYTFKFVYADNDEAIHVEWEPTTTDILVSKVWKDGDDKDGMRAAAYDNSSTVPEFKLQYSINGGKTWDDVTDKVWQHDLVHPVTEQAVPSGHDSGKFLDGTYTINNDLSGNHPFTWEYLPVYTYDNNGTADRLISYRVVEEPPTGIEDYQNAKYYDHQSFELTSEKSKSWDGWLIYEHKDTHKHYASRGDGFYYEVVKDADDETKDGKVKPEPADPQPKTEDLTAVSSDEYRTADKALPYQALDVRDEHTPNEIYVEVTKEWQDSALKGQSAGVANDYERRDLRFILHGETEKGPVDLNPDDPASDDLERIISKTESETKEKATGYKTIDGYKVYKDKSRNLYAKVENKEGCTDGYYAVSEDAINYASGPATQVDPDDLKAVRNDGTYKISEDKYGARFDDLPTHEDGKLITYTVKEQFRNERDDQWVDAGNNELPWITTGGVLDPVRDSATDEIVGYTTEFINTAVYEDVYVTLPMTIHKRDANTAGALEGAGFTVYLNAGNRTKAVEPADTKVEGRQIYIGGNTEYVLRDGKYYTFAKNDDGSYTYTLANPQPEKGDLKAKRAMVESAVVTTGTTGYATVSFLEPGTYYLVETAAPEGYAADQTVYEFKVDRSLKSIKLMRVDGTHSTKWWEKLWDLLFHDGIPKEINWNKTDKTLTVDDEPLRASILVRKSWTDNSDQDGVRPDDGDETMPKVILQWTAGAHTATGLPVYKDGSSNEYIHNQKDNKYYPVTKEDVAGSYEAGAAAPQPADPSKTADTCQGRTVYRDTDNNEYVYVDGAYHKVNSVDTAGSVDAQPASPQPKEADLELVMDAGSVWHVTMIPGDTAGTTEEARAPVTYAGGSVLTHQHDAYTWNGVPAYRDGRPVTYRIAEESQLLSDGVYSLKYSHTSETKEKVFTLVDKNSQALAIHNQTVDVTNEHITRVINLEAYKTWTDTDPEKRQAATLTLYKTVNGATSVVTKTEGGHTAPDTGTVPVQSDDWSKPVKTWNDLPVYEYGYPITYRIEETSIDGYRTSYEVDYTKAATDTESEEPVTKDGDSIDASVVKRTYYSGGDIPEGKSEGDESTTARYRITNEETIDIEVKKTWVDGANTNVTYELWRTTTPKNNLTTSNLTKEGNIIYYETKVAPKIRISKQAWNDLPAEEKEKYGPVEGFTWTPYNLNAQGSKQYTDDTTVIDEAEYKGLSDDEKARYKVLMADGWEPAAGDDGKQLTHTFIAADFSTTSPEDTKTYTFDDLPKNDESGKPYLYRVTESPKYVRYGSNQAVSREAAEGSDIQIRNINLQARDAVARVQVVKELEGRKWTDSDEFCFEIEAAGGRDGESVIEAKDVPMPRRQNADGTLEVMNTANTDIDSHVGALGRTVPFGNIIYKDDYSKSPQPFRHYHAVENGHTAEFYYTVREVYGTDGTVERDGVTWTTTKSIDEATDHTGIDGKGIKYEGNTDGGIFKPTEHKLTVKVTNKDNALSAEVFWDDSSNANTVPVITNSYDASAPVSAYMIKRIRGRKFESGDEFKFFFANLPGSVVRTTEDGEATRDYSGGTTATIKHDSKRKVEPVPGTDYFKPSADDTPSDRGNYRASRSDLTGFYKVRDLSNKTADGRATDIFIYELYERDYKSEDPSRAANDNDLQLDGKRVYMKVVVTDNLDGTLDVQSSYHTEASCTADNLIRSKVLVCAVDQDGIFGLIGSHNKGDIAPKGADPEATDPEGKKLYEYVPAAMFTNDATFDIPVEKEWVDGPALEDVTLRIRRHLFPLSAEIYLDGKPSSETDTQLYGDDYVRSEYERCPKEEKPDFWKNIGRVHNAERGDFEEKSSMLYENIENFNRNLPKYVTDDKGITYRAVYLLTEDETSHAYQTSYKSIQDDGTVKPGDNIFIDSGKMVVTNKVKASNVAKIAAVKQLIGRKWLDGDRFGFALEPVGKAEYDDDGKFSGIIETKDIPMPESDGVISYAYADPSTQTVDPNGGYERLARFKEIRYKVDDLVYNEKEKHMQGDFFYVMKERIPDDAVNSDGIAYSEASEKQKKAGGFRKDGIIYDSDEYTVHVEVRENRTDTLTVQVAYGEKTVGDISTGNPYTPVYTNKYNAYGNAVVKLDKYIMGRDWKAGDKFDFVMIPMAGAPFVDGDRSEFPPKDTHSDKERDADLEAGYAIHNKEGEHVKRLKVTDTTKGENVQSLSFPKLRFAYSDLSLTTSSDGVIKYPDEYHMPGTKPVPAGFAYGQFMYAIEETDDFNAQPEDLFRDKDTEYARLTVIDLGNGKLDYYVEIFADRYASERRMDPETGQPASAVTFVNKLKRDISAAKAWDDPATSDVSIRLQWSVNNGGSWYDVAATPWMSRNDGTRIIKKNATGADLTVTWNDLPAYSNYSGPEGDDGDDKDLNDSWIIYRIAEDPVSHVYTRYNETAYKDGDDIDTKKDDDTPKYLEPLKDGSPFHTEAEKEEGKYPEQRTKQLYVTNFRKDIEGKAKFGVVKQYVGKNWDDEVFSFKLTPLKSALGDKADSEEYTDYDPETNRMPVLSDNTASASKDTTAVSVNEHAADFDELTVKLSDLKVASDGIAKGVFVYTISETVPDGAVSVTEGDKTYKIVEDSNGNKIKYTTETHTVKIKAVDNGNGKIETTVSYDDRGTGEFVPVYTNYAMTPTPLTGTKTWVGGEETEHVNGTLSLNEDKTEILEATDSLGIKLMRRSAGSSTDPSPVNERDGKLYDDAGRELVIVWAEQKEHESSEATYTDQTKGNGTFTVMAKTVDGAYVAPYLNRVDKDGSRYIYSVTEPTGAPEHYAHQCSGMDVTNTYNIRDSIKVHKTWDDADGSGKYDAEGLRPDKSKVVLHLYRVIEEKSAGGTVYSLEQVPVDAVTLTKDGAPSADGGNAQWDDLPVYDSDGKKISYIVLEESVAGYITAYKTETSPAYVEAGDSPASVEALWIRLDGTTGAQTVDVKNSLTPATDTIKVSKIWDDGNDVDGVRPESITFELYEYVWNKTGKKYDDAAHVTDKDLTVTAADGWTKSWTGLPRTKNGRTVIYTVKEKESPVSGYQDAVITGDQFKGFTAMNRHVPETASASITKVWVDSSNSRKTRPDTLETELWRWYEGSDGLRKYQHVTEDASGKTIKELMSADDRDGNVNKWSKTVDDLPKYILVDIGGKKVSKEYTYFWREKIPEGYRAAASSNTSGKPAEAGYKKADNGATLTNTVDKINVRITKRWIDKAGNTVRPSAADFGSKLQLKAGSEPVEGHAPAVTDNNDGTYTIVWTGLPAYEENAGPGAEPIVYSVTESEISGYAKPVYSNVDDPSTSADESSVIDKAYNGGRITNTQEIKVNVEKTWNDNDNHDDKRDDIKVTLYQNGVELPRKFGDAEKTLKESDDNRTSSQDGNTWTWSSAWSGLPYADENGSPYNYTATETDPGAWYKALFNRSIRQILLIKWNESSDTLTFDVTNEPAEDRISFAVDKIWNDGSDADDLRPEKITYRLYQKIGLGAETAVETLPDGASVELLTNAGTPAAAGTYSDGKIEINADKTDAAQGTLSRVVFKDLPKYDVDSSGKIGSKISYSIKEDKVFGYTTLIQGKYNTGFTVRNSHEPAIVSVKAKALKVIRGRKFKDSDEFTFLITPKNGAPAPEKDWVTVRHPELSGSSEEFDVGTFTFTGADMSDKKAAGDTKTFEYEVSEANGGKTVGDLIYDSSKKTLKIKVTRKADGSLEIGADDVVWGRGSEGEDTFTNVGGTTDVVIRKIWVDKDADETVIGERPDSITVTVNAKTTVETQSLVEAGFTPKSGSGNKEYTKDIQISKDDDGTLFNSNVWQHRLIGLPEYDAGGEHKIVYSAAEHSVPNYESSVKEDKGRFIITNTYERSSFTGTKVWIDGGKEHDNATELNDRLELQRTTDQTGAAGWEEVTEKFHIHWNPDGEKTRTEYTQSFTITGLPEKDRSGNAYIYRVKENLGDDASHENYHVTYSNIDDPDTQFDERSDRHHIYDDGTITNTLVENVDIAGEKKWVGGEAADHINADENGKDILGLSLKRISSKEGSAEETLTVDDSGKELVVVWDDRTGNQGYEFLAVDESAAEGTTEAVLKEADSEGYEYIYTVVETKVPEDYRVSYHDFNITNTASTVTDITAEKIWEGDDHVKEDTRNNVHLQLYQTVDGATRKVDGEKIIEKNTTAAAGEKAGTAKWKDKPLYIDHDRVTYTVKEVNVPDGYTASVRYGHYVEDGGEQVEKWEKEPPADWNYHVRIINTLNTDRTKAVVMKKWDDNNDQDGMRPDDVTVRIKAAGWDGNDLNGEKVADIVLDDNNNWKGVFIDLPKTDKDGKDYDYTVEEIEVPDGYTPKVSGDTDDGFVITNKHVPGRKTIEAKKVWEGDDKVGTSLRSDVILHLYGIDENGLVVFDAGTKKIEMDDDGEPKSKAVWTNVPERHYNNKDLEWTITEEPVFGYTSEVSGSASGSFTVTNTYTGPTTSVKVSKEWKDTYYESYKGHPSEITYQLLRKVGDEDAEIADKKTVTADDNWSYTWTDLPVTEKVKTEGASTRTEYEEVHKKEGNEYFYTDTETGEEVKYTAEQYDELSDDVKAKLEPVNESVPKKVTEESSKYTEETILYSVQEVPPEQGYIDPIIECTAPGVFRAVNIHRTETLNIDAVKVWNDNENADGIRPDHVTLKLMNGEKEVRKANVTADDEWKHTFMNIPATDINGDDIVYTVNELKVEGYEKSISGNQQEGFTITNTHNAGSLMTLRATKKWEGDKTDIDKRKDVTFELVRITYEDEHDTSGSRRIVKDSQKTVATGNKHDENMTAEWKDLPTVINGKRVFYTVEETSTLHGYTAHYSDVTEVPDKPGEYEMTVTNILGEIPELADVIYVDPKNPKGQNKMIVKSTSYRTPEEARSAAENRKGAPADPKHDGVKFLGWDLNWDENDNFVLVAVYSDIPAEVTPVTTYIDPLSGKPVLISKLTNDPSSVKVPDDPRHKNVQFAGWVKCVDAGGNTIFVAKFEPDCANRANTNGDGKKVRTGDEDNAAFLWVVVMILSMILLSVYVTQRTRENRSRR